MVCGLLVSCTGGIPDVGGRSPQGEGPTKTEEATPSGPALAAACAGRETIQADLDGDGLQDLVFHDWIGDGPVLGVCTGDGKTDSLPGEGMSELLAVGDVQPDGRDEIFYGGTSAIAGYWSLAVFLYGKLRPVRLPNGLEFFVVEGIEGGELGSAPTSSAWGCEDTGRDGRREVVQVTVELEGKAWRWTRESFQVRGARATSVGTESGTMPASEGELEASRALVSPCEIRTE